MGSKKFIRCLSIMLILELSFNVLTYSDSVIPTSQDFDNNFFVDEEMLSQFFNVIRLQAEAFLEEQFKLLERKILSSDKSLRHRRNIHKERHTPLSFPENDLKLQPPTVAMIFQSTCAITDFAVVKAYNTTFIVEAGTPFNGTADIALTVRMWNETAFLLKDFGTVNISGALSVETFDIHGEPYFIYTVNPNSDLIDPKIRRTKLYKIKNNGRITSIQTFLTVSSTKWKHFVLHGKTYLAQASYLKYTGTKRNVVDCEETMLKGAKSVVIHQWIGVGFQKLLTVKGSYVSDLDYCSAHGRHFLLVANRKMEHRIGSFIFVYEVTSHTEKDAPMPITLKLFQKLPSSSPRSIRCFKVGETLHLVVADEFRIVSGRRYYDVDSSIYRFNGLFFVRFQQLSATGGAHWSVFGAAGLPHRAPLLHLQSREMEQLYWFNGRSWRPTSVAAISQVSRFLDLGNGYTLASMPHSMAVLKWIGIDSQLPSRQVCASLKARSDDIFARQETLQAQWRVLESALYRSRVSSPTEWLESSRSAEDLSRAELNAELMQTGEELNALEKLIGEDKASEKRKNGVLHHVVVENLMTSSITTKSLSVVEVNGVKFDEFVDDAVKIIPYSENRLSLSEHRFLDHVRLNGPVTLKGTINGLVFEDDFAFLGASNVFQAPITVNAVHAFRGMTISGTLDGVSLDNVLLTRGRQTVESQLVFAKDVRMESLRVLSGKVDGVDWDALTRDALYIDGRNAATFRGHLEFAGGLRTTSDLRVVGSVNSLNLTDMKQNILTVDGNQTISAPIHFMKAHFIKDVFVNTSMVNGWRFPQDFVLTSDRVWKVNRLGFVSMDTHTLEVQGKVNGYNLSTDLMTVQGTQLIFGRKEFEEIRVPGVNWTKGDAHRTSHYVKHIEAEKITVHGKMYPNVDELATSALTSDSDIVCSRATFRDSVTFHDLFLPQSVLGSDLVPLHHPHPLTLRVKSLRNVVMKDHVTVRGTVNGLDLAEFARGCVSLQEDQVIRSRLTFTDEIRLMSSRLHVLNASSPSAYVLSTDRDGKRTLNIKKDLIVDSLDVTEMTLDPRNKFCGIRLTDFFNDTLLRDERQYVNGTKRVESNIFVDAADTSSLDNLKVIGRMSFGGRDWNHLVSEAVLVDEDVKILTPVEMRTPIHVQHLRSDVIDGVDLKDLFSNYLYVNETRRVTIDGTVKIGSLKSKVLNNVDIEHYYNDSVLINTELVAKGLRFEKVTVKRKLVFTGTINGLWSKDIVLRNKKVIVFRGAKEFKGPVYVCGDFQVVEGIGNTVHHTSLGNVLAVDRLIINGKLYAKELEGINWKEFEENALLFGSSAPVRLKNNFIFDELTLDVDQVVVGGLLSGFNVTKLARTMVTLDTPQAVLASLEFLGGVVFKKEVHALQSTFGRNAILQGRPWQWWTDYFRSSQINGSRRTTIFLGPVSIHGDLLVRGRVNGIKMEDIVKTRNFPTVLNRNLKTKVLEVDSLQVNGLLMNVDVRKWLQDRSKLRGAPLIIRGRKSFSAVRFSEATVCQRLLKQTGGIRNISLLLQCPGKNGTLTITGSVTFKNTVTSPKVKIAANVSTLIMNRETCEQLSQLESMMRLLPIRLEDFTFVKQMKGRLACHIHDYSDSGSRGVLLTISESKSGRTLDLITVHLDTGIEQLIGSIQLHGDILHCASFADERNNLVVVFGISIGRRRDLAIWTSVVTQMWRIDYHMFSDIAALPDASGDLRWFLVTSAQDVSEGILYLWSWSSVRREFEVAQLIPFTGYLTSRFVPTLNKIVVAFQVRPWSTSFSVFTWNPQRMQFAPESTVTENALIVRMEICNFRNGNVLVLLSKYGDLYIRPIGRSGSTFEKIKVARTSSGLFCSKQDGLTLTLLSTRFGLTALNESGRIQRIEMPTVEKVQILRSFKNNFIIIQKPMDCKFDYRKKHCTFGPVDVYRSLRYDTLGDCLRSCKPEKYAHSPFPNQTFPTSTASDFRFVPSGSDLVPSGSKSVPTTPTLYSSSTQKSITKGTVDYGEDVSSPDDRLFSGWTESTTPALPPASPSAGVPPTHEITDLPRTFSIDIFKGFTEIATKETDDERISSEIRPTALVATTTWFDGSKKTASWFRKPTTDAVEIWERSSPRSVSTHAPDVEGTSPLHHTETVTKTADESFGTASSTLLPIEVTTTSKKPMVPTTLQTEDIDYAFSKSTPRFHLQTDREGTRKVPEEVLLPTTPLPGKATEYEGVEHAVSVTMETSDERRDEGFTDVTRHVTPTKVAVPRMTTMPDGTDYVSEVILTTVPDEADVSRPDGSGTTAEIASLEIEDKKDDDRPTGLPDDGQTYSEKTEVGVITTAMPMWIPDVQKKQDLVAPTLYTDWYDENATVSFSERTSMSGDVETGTFPVVEKISSTSASPEVGFSEYRTRLSPFSTDRIPFFSSLTTDGKIRASTGIISTTTAPSITWDKHDSTQSTARLEATLSSETVGWQHSTTLGSSSPHPPEQKDFDTTLSPLMMTSSATGWTKPETTTVSSAKSETATVSPSKPEMMTTFSSAKPDTTTTTTTTVSWTKPEATTRMVSSAKPETTTTSTFTWQKPKTTTTTFSPAKPKTTTTPTFSWAKPATTTTMLSPAKPETTTTSTFSWAKPETTTTSTFSWAKPETTTTSTFSWAKPDSTTTSTFSWAKPETTTTMLSPAKPETTTTSTFSWAKPDSTTTSTFRWAKPETTTTTLSPAKPETTTTTFSPAKPESTTTSPFKWAKPEITTKATTKWPGWPTSEVWMPPVPISSDMQRTTAAITSSSYGPGETSFAVDTTVKSSTSKTGISTSKVNVTTSSMMPGVIFPSKEYPTVMPHSINNCTEKEGFTIVVSDEIASVSKGEFQTSTTVPETTYSGIDELLSTVKSDDDVQIDHLEHSTVIESETASKQPEVVSTLLPSELDVSKEREMQSTVLSEDVHLPKGSVSSTFLPEEGEISEDVRMGSTVKSVVLVEDADERTTAQTSLFEETVVPSDDLQFVSTFKPKEPIPSYEEQVTVKTEMPKTIFDAYATDLFSTVSVSKEVGSPEQVTTEEADVAVDSATLPIHTTVIIRDHVSSKDHATGTTELPLILHGMVSPRNFVAMSTLDTSETKESVKDDAGFSTLMPDFDLASSRDSAEVTTHALEKTSDDFDAIRPTTMTPDELVKLSHAATKTTTFDMVSPETYARLSTLSPEETAVSEPHGDFSVVQPEITRASDAIEGIDGFSTVSADDVIHGKDISIVSTSDYTESVKKDFVEMSTSTPEEAILSGEITERVSTLMPEDSQTSEDQTKMATSMSEDRFHPDSDDVIRLVTPEGTKSAMLDLIEDADRLSTVSVEEVVYKKDSDTVLSTLRTELFDSGREHAVEISTTSSPGEVVLSREFGKDVTTVMTEDSLASEEQTKMSSPIVADHFHAGTIQLSTHSIPEEDVYQRHTTTGTRIPEDVNSVMHPLQRTTERIPEEISLPGVVDYSTVMPHETVTWKRGQDVSTIAAQEMVPHEPGSTVGTDLPEAFIEGRYGDVQLSTVKELDLAAEHEVMLSTSIPLKTDASLRKDVEFSTVKSEEMAEVEKQEATVESMIMHTAVEGIEKDEDRTQVAATHVPEVAMWDREETVHLSTAVPDKIRDFSEIGADMTTLLALDLAKDIAIASSTAMPGEEIISRRSTVLPVEVTELDSLEFVAKAPTGIATPLLKGLEPSTLHPEESYMEEIGTVATAFSIDRTSPKDVSMLSTTVLHEVASEDHGFHLSSMTPEKEMLRSKEELLVSTGFPQHEAVTYEDLTTIKAEMVSDRRTMDAFTLAFSERLPGHTDAHYDYTPVSLVPDEKDFLKPYFEITTAQPGRIDSYEEHFDAATTEKVREATASPGDFVEKSTLMHKEVMPSRDDREFRSSTSWPPPGKLDFYDEQSMIPDTSEETIEEREGRFSTLIPERMDSIVEHLGTTAGAEFPLKMVSSDDFIPLTTMIPERKDSFMEHGGTTSLTQGLFEMVSSKDFAPMTTMIPERPESFMEHRGTTAGTEGPFEIISSKDFVPVTTMIPERQDSFVEQLGTTAGTEGPFEMVSSKDFIPVTTTIPEKLDSYVDHLGTTARTEGLFEMVSSKDFIPVTTTIPERLNYYVEHHGTASGTEGPFEMVSSIEFIPVTTMLPERQDSFVEHRGATAGTEGPFEMVSSKDFIPVTTMVPERLDSYVEHNDTTFGTEGPFEMVSSKEFTSVTTMIPKRQDSFVEHRGTTAGTEGPFEMVSSKDFIPVTITIPEKMDSYVHHRDTTVGSEGPFEMVSSKDFIPLTTMVPERLDSYVEHIGTTFGTEGPFEMVSSKEFIPVTTMIPERQDSFVEHRGTTAGTEGPFEMVSSKDFIPVTITIPEKMDSYLHHRDTTVISEGPFEMVSSKDIIPVTTMIPERLDSYVEHIGTTFGTEGPFEMVSSKEFIPITTMIPERQDSFVEHRGTTAGTEGLFEMVSSKDFIPVTTTIPERQDSFVEQLGMTAGTEGPLEIVSSKDFIPVTTTIPERLESYVEHRGTTSEAEGPFEQISSKDILATTMISERLVSFDEHRGTTAGTEGPIEMVSSKDVIQVTTMVPERLDSFVEQLGTTAGTEGPYEMVSSKEFIPVTTVVPERLDSYVEHRGTTAGTKAPLEMISSRGFIPVTTPSDVGVSSREFFEASSLSQEDSVVLEDLGLPTVTGSIEGLDSFEEIATSTVVHLEKAVQTLQPTTVVSDVYKIKVAIDEPTSSVPLIDLDERTTVGHTLHGDEEFVAMTGPLAEVATKISAEFLDLSATRESLVIGTAVPDDELISDAPVDRLTEESAPATVPYDSFVEESTKLILVVRNKTEKTPIHKHSDCFDGHTHVTSMEEEHTEETNEFQDHSKVTEDSATTMIAENEEEVTDFTTVMTTQMTDEMTESEEEFSTQITSTTEDDTGYGGNFRCNG